MPDTTQYAAKAYELARAEVLERMALRDRTIVFYLGAIGVLFAAAATGDTTQYEILLVVPFLAVGVSTLVAQHSQALAAVVRYCRNDLGKYLAEQEINVPIWDSSRFSIAVDKSNVFLRSFGEALVVLAPSFVALYLAFEAVTSTLAGGIIWSLSVAATVSAAVFHVHYFVKRRRLLHESTN